jgi:hypothetical protein
MRRKIFFEEDLVERDSQNKYPENIKNMEILPLFAYTSPFIWFVIPIPL